MKMKKILNEWRRFIVKEGVSDIERAMSAVDNIKNSFDVSNKEAQKKIASIYLPWSLQGANPQGAVEFYSGVNAEKAVLEVVKDLIVAIEGLEESGEASNDSNYFSVEHAGEHTQHGNQPKIRVRSLLSDAAQGVFDDTQEIYNRVNHLTQKIKNYDFDFSDLSPKFQLAPGKAGYQRGADAGTGGVQTPPGMTPQEEAEFEEQMMKYSATHNDVRNSLGKDKDKQHYDMLQKAGMVQKEFFKYMYDLWSSKAGEKNQMTAMYRAAAQEDDYNERLRTLVTSPDMQSQFEKEEMSDMSTLEADFARGMTTTDRAEAEKVFRKLKAARDNRSRLIRQRMRTL